MTFTPDQVAQLKAPLSRSHVKQRSQAGRQLSYIEGWVAIAEANRIFGFDAWNRETVEMRQLGEPRLVDGKYRVGYMAKVCVTVFGDDRYITREGTGYGSGIDRDVGSAHESAIKEAETDAMKRALMTFGNPFGLALYDKEQANVTDDEPETRTNGERAPDPTDFVTGKNPPGISAVKVEVREAMREIHSCSDWEQLAALLPSLKPLFIKVATVFKSEWVGPDGTGLKGETMKVATTLGNPKAMQTWLNRCETATPPAIETPKQAAE